MVNMQLEEIIERVTHAVIQQLQQGDSARADPRSTILVILTSGSPAELEQGVRQIAKLGQMPVQITVICSEMAQKTLSLQQFDEMPGTIAFVETKNNLDARQFITQFDLVLIPVLTQNIAVKVAQLLRDDVVTDVIAEAIIAAKPTLAATDAIFAAETMPPTYKASLNRMLQQLQSYGIIFTRLIELPEKAARMVQLSSASKATQSPFRGNPSQGYPLYPKNQHVTQNVRKRRLITARDVEEVARSGAKQISGKNALITPLARDRAKELGVMFDPGN